MKISLPWKFSSLRKIYGNYVDDTFNTIVSLCNGNLDETNVIMAADSLLVQGKAASATPTANQLVSLGTNVRFPLPTRRRAFATSFLQEPLSTQGNMLYRHFTGNDPLIPLERDPFGFAYAHPSANQVIRAPAGAVRVRVSAQLCCTRLVGPTTQTWAKFRAGKIDASGMTIDMADPASAEISTMLFPAATQQENRYQVNGIWAPTQEGFLYAAEHLTDYDTHIFDNEGLVTEWGYLTVYFEYS